MYMRRGVLVASFAIGPRGAFFLARASGGKRSQRRPME